jgi:hypothetical protein
MFPWSSSEQVFHAPLIMTGRLNCGHRIRKARETRTGPNGAFRYVVRPAVRGRPKPRLLAVVDYWSRSNGRLISVHEIV